MHREVVFDIEADGLLDTVTKIHCLSYRFVEKPDEVFTLTLKSDIRCFIEDGPCKDSILIGHNIIGYDLKAVEKILGSKTTCKIIDTLPLSWHLNHSRTKHGLAEYGEDFGVPKPKIDDWENQTLEEYIHRCEEDTLINLKLWKQLDGKLDQLYGTNEDKQRLISYTNFKMQCIADQEEVGIELDYDKAVRHKDELLIAQEEKVVELKKVMPKVPKTTKKTKPKITHKKDGTLSVVGSNWFSLLKSNGLSMTFNGELEVITGYEEPNPNSTPQVKDWLFSLGWKPATYKFVRDKATGDERKIEQVRKDGELCPSVLRLAKVEPNISLLEGLSIIQHRLGMFQGFIDSSYTKEINGETKHYVKSEIGGLTNTLRFKHKKPIANMPKVGVAWGEEIRGCLIATSPHLLCGSDLVSLESTTKRHYMYLYDPEYVNEMGQEGFDEHLNLAVFAGAITQEELNFYNWYKERS